MYTLDASVWLREATPSDPAYQVCHELLSAIRQQQITLYEPWLLLAEVAGPVGRLLRDPVRGRVYADIVHSFPNTTFVDVDEAIGRAAAELAADRFIRGADAVYPVIAQRYGCSLVSLDDEHQRRLPGYVVVLTPAEALKQLLR
jgi:predicted nucleic acid-binding protein